MPATIQPPEPDPRFKVFCDEFRKRTGFHVDDLTDRDWWAYGIETNPVRAAEEAAAEFLRDPFAFDMMY